MKDTENLSSGIILKPSRRYNSKTLIVLVPCPTKTFFFLFQNFSTAILLLFMKNAYAWIMICNVIIIHNQ